MSLKKYATASGTLKAALEGAVFFMAKLAKRIE